MSTDSQLEGGRAPAPRKTIAHTMLVDTRTGDITIDGVTLPWWLASEPTVDPAASPGLPALVSLEMHVDNVFVVRTLEEDLQFIKDLGAKQRSEAVKAFKAKVERERYADMKARLADKDARRPAQLSFLQRLTRKLP